MEYQYLNEIDSPADLKKLPREALPQVCKEVRDFIIRELSHNPGHLASSLGTVELTVALHYVFDTPKDQLVWDVGHQAYAHKILTGRRSRFHTNRQFKGLAPFPTPQESKYDAFVAGHASNSISAALGIEIAEQRLAEMEHRPAHHTVAIIGDGAMTGGLAFEGLNNTSMDKNNLLIVLNDNHMAIDPIEGGFTQYLLDITTSSAYNKWRWWMYKGMKKMHLINDKRKMKVIRFNNNLKAILTHQQHNVFQNLNIRYFGPANGHNVIDLVRILMEIKDHKGPKVLHIITRKGYGYEPAEQDQITWHAPGEFKVETGERICPNTPTPLWQEVWGEELLAMAKENDKIVGVTPAMPSGCSLCIMQKQMPERVFDVGIAEGHAVTFSAGLAKQGLLPYCNIYSSFMQRAYDNIIHDVALGNLHVVLCVDRAGIVGNDGATHHGLLDMAYLRPIPNISIAAPMTATDLQQMMRLSQTISGPVAIRYPRGRSQNRNDLPLVEYGRGICLRQGTDVAVISIGAIGNTVEEAILLTQQPSRFGHYNMRWLKPLDNALLHTICTRYRYLVTVEDGMVEGGLADAVLEYMCDNHITLPLMRLGVHNQFVEHGSTKELYQMLHLDKEGICESLLQVPVK